MVRMKLRSHQAAPADLSLRELRQALGFTQAELAAVLGTTQPAVLKSENATDPQLSTITRYLEGLATLDQSTLDLHLVASIGEVIAEIRFPSSDAARQAAIQDPGAEGGAPPRASAVWRLRAWDDPMLETTWMSESILSMSADEIGDLTTWPGEREVGERLAAALPDRGQQAIGMFTTYWRYFRVEMTPGDVVIVPLSTRRAAIGRLVGDYEYEKGEIDVRLRHRRGVEWIRTVPRSDLDEDIRRVVNAPGTICRVTASDAAGRLVP